MSYTMRKIAFASMRSRNSDFVAYCKRFGNVEEMSGDDRSIIFERILATLFVETLRW